MDARTRRWGEPRMISEGYPLQFPANKERTIYPERANFRDHSVAQATIELMNEVRMLGGTKLIISSNLLLRADGLPYSGRTPPRDVGVAVYFELDGKQQCFPCDRWDRVEHNMWAIFKSIQAIRGLQRWGAKDMMESAFKGFQALPSPENVTNTNVRYFSGLSLEDGKKTFKQLALELHPDKGGTQEEFMELNKQYLHFKQSTEGVE